MTSTFVHKDTQICMTRHFDKNATRSLMAREFESPSEQALVRNVPSLFFKGPDTAEQSTALTQRGCDASMTTHAWCKRA